MCARNECSTGLVSTYQTLGVILAGPDAGGKPLQLRDVAAMLRKTDDPKSVMRALKVLPGLISQAPDELTAYGGETPPPLSLSLSPPLSYSLSLSLCVCAACFLEE